MTIHEAVRRLALCLLGLPLSLSLAGPPAAAAAGQSAAPAAAEAAQPAAPQKKKVRLDEVVVRGDVLLEGLDAMDATVLDNAQITDRVFVTPLDIAELSPGVTINQYHQGGTAAAFQMRGFTSCSHGPDAAIFLDGVPLNETDGYADTNVIIPEEIERVEIVKGPASALYGNYASAGALAFYTYKTGDFTRLKAQYGSFNTADGVAVIAREDEKLSQVYAGEVYHTDGYQDNSDWDKQNAAARWTYRLNERLEGSLGVRGYSSTWDAPGYIPQQVYDSHPSSAVNDVNGGDKKRGEVRGDLGWRVSPNSKLLAYGWTVQQDFNRYYQNWVSDGQAPGSNYGNKRYLQREVYGAGLSYNYVGEIVERETKMILGLDFMREKEHREYWNLVVGNGRNLGSKYLDYEITLYTTALFGEFNYQLAKPLRLVLGGRYDMFSGDLNDNLPSGDYDRGGPDIFSPKAGLVFTVRPGWDLYANYGRGFALPRGTDLWKRSYLDPAIREQYELGLRAAPFPWMDFGASLWRLDTSDDFQPTIADPTELENAGETRRQGIETEVNLYPAEHVRLHLDYAYIDATYRNYIDGGVNRDGNRLSGVPENVLNAEAAYEPPKGVGGRLRYRWVSDWNIDSANTLSADGYQVVDAQVSYRFDKRYRLALDIVNLLDEKYSEYVGYANGVKTYAPADPISAYLTLTIDW